MRAVSPIIDSLMLFQPERVAGLRLRHEERLSGALSTILCGGLAATLFFAIAGLSSSFGLQYNVGYEVIPIDLVVFSKSTDPYVWLLTVSATSLSSLVLVALTRREKKRTLYLAFLLGSVLQISLFFLNELWAAFLASPVFDVVILVAWILLYKRPGLRSQSRGLLMSCACFLGILVIVESLALVSRALTQFYGSNLPFLARPELLQTQMSGSLFTFSPILMLVAMYIWAPMLLFAYRRHSAIRKTAPTSNPVRANQAERNVSFALLGTAIAIAVVIPLIPYVRQTALRGVDVLDYYSRLSSVSSLGDAVGLITSPASHETPYLILLYLIERGTGCSAYQALIVGPIFLALFYTVTVYLLTQELTRNAIAAGAGAIFASSWFHTTVGMFAAIYANWLAISFAVLCSYFMIRAIRGDTKRRALFGLFAVVLAYTTALSHIWTWTILMLVHLFALLIVIPVHGGDGTARWHAKTYAVIILFSVLPMLVMVPAMPGVSHEFSSSQVSVFNIVKSVSPTRISHLLPGVSFTLREYVGAILSYGWVFVLAILGGIGLAKNNPKAATLFAAWLVVTSVSIILLDPVYQWRVLYVIPFEVYSAIGVLGLLEGLSWASALGTTGPHLVTGVKILLVALIVLDSINRGLMNAAIPPAG